MEGEGAALACLELPKHGLRLEKLVCDEDSVMLAKCNDPVRIPAHLRPVKKLSDPNHIKKILNGQLSNEKQLNWSARPEVLSQTIIQYLCRNFMYVLQQQAAATAGLPLAQQIKIKRQAVLNIPSHAFGWHTGCKYIVVKDPQGHKKVWCGFHREGAQYKPHLPYGKWLVGLDQYKAIYSIFRAFASDAVIEKSFHGEDSNNNENFNKMVSDVCPKATFAGRRGRFSAAVGYAVASKNEGRGVASSQVLLELTNMPPSSAAERFSSRAAGKRAYLYSYQAQTKVKKRRLELKNLKKTTGNAGNDEYSTGRALHDI